jgi:hypothetical protein
MYLSALKELLLAEDQRVLEVVLPNLAAFRAIRQGKDILSKKKVDLKKEIDKMEREGKKTGGSLNVTAFQATGGAGAMPETKETIVAAKSKATSKSPVRGGSPTKGMTAEEKKQSLLMQQSQNDFAAQEKELERQEIKKYGRMFIWEGYTHPSKNEQWVCASEKLRHINSHVI